MPPLALSSAISGAGKPAVSSAAVSGVMPSAVAAPCTASIHRSLDGTKVINYAQWRSQADFAALKDNPKARPHMQAAAALASFEPIVCEVVDSISVK